MLAKIASQMHLSNPKKPGEIIVNMNYWGIVYERRCGASVPEDIVKKDIPERIAAWKEVMNVPWYHGGERLNLKGSISRSRFHRITLKR